MIPKRIHLIWIGPHEPLWPCIDSWRRDFVQASPGWEVWLWRDADIERFGLKNRGEYEATRPLCGKADIARYEIVHRHGGVYIDADSYWLGRPLEPLLEQARDTGFLGTSEGSPELLNCGFFGSVAGHELLRTVIQELPARIQRYAGEPQWIQTGPTLLGDVHQRLLQEASRPLATLVPFSALYAASWLQRSDRPLSEVIAGYRQEGEAICFQLGYSTHELWRQRLDFGVLPP